MDRRTIQLHENRSLDIGVQMFRQTGKRNLSLGKSCEDTIYIRHIPDLSFYGIADGQSNKAHCAEGGRICLECAADFVQEYGIDCLRSYSFQDELPCILMQRIRKAISCRAEKIDASFSDYASTVLAVAIDRQQGWFVTLHLGDGAMLCTRKDRSIVPLCFEESGLSHGCTYLSTSANSISHFRISYGVLDNIDRIILFSDGLHSLCRGKNVPHRAAELLSSGSSEDVLAYVRRYSYEDDASCILLDISLNE